MKSPARPVPGADRDARGVLDALRRLVRGLRLYARRCEMRLGLSAAQLFALREVADRGPLNLRGLAAATRTDLSSASVVAARLARKGLISHRRSGDDRRRVELAATPRGRTLLARSPDPLQVALLRSFGGLPAARRRALRRDLERLVRGAGLGPEPARLFFEDEA